MKKVLFLTLAIFVFTGTIQCAYSKTVKKEIEVQTKDSRIIKATVTYVKIDKVKKYPTVLLLHSLGYSSKDWGNLIPDLNNAGYAVIAMDFRGHGQSIFDGSFHQKTWTYFKPKTYQKFPSDAIAVMNEAQTQVKQVSLDNLAIVGADIGANTAVLVARQLRKKPKTLVLICPTISFKGLYIPLAMSEMGMIPILSMVSTQDGYSMQQQKALSKFAQGGFYAKNYPKGGMGMTMIKVNPAMSQDITKWIIKYLK